MTKQSLESKVAHTISKFIRDQLHYQYKATITKVEDHYELLPEHSPGALCFKTRKEAEDECRKIGWKLVSEEEEEE